MIEALQFGSLCLVTALGVTAFAGLAIWIATKATGLYLAAVLCIAVVIFWGVRGNS